MNPFVATTARMIARDGRTMTVRRRQAQTTTFDDTAVRGVLHLFRPDELSGAISQGDARVLIAALAGLTPRRGDFILVDGRTWGVQGATPRYVANEVASWDLWVRGG